MEEWKCFRTNANLVPNWLCLTLILSISLVSRFFRNSLGWKFLYGSVKSFNPIMNGAAAAVLHQKWSVNSSLSGDQFYDETDAPAGRTRDNYAIPGHFSGHFSVHSLINPIWLDFYPNRGFWRIKFYWCVPLLLLLLLVRAYVGIEIYWWMVVSLFHLSARFFEDWFSLIPMVDCGGINGPVKWIYRPPWTTAVLTNTVDKGKATGIHPLFIQEG